jgi:regulator of replication initiation timing
MTEEKFNEMEKKYQGLQGQIENLKNRITDLEIMRNPDEIAGKVILIEEWIDALKTSISNLNIKLEAYVNSNKYIELFTDEEFKNLYMESGLVAKDVAKLIEKKFKNVDTSAPAISKIINGQIGSLELRSYLGKLFRYEIAKRQ